MLLLAEQRRNGSPSAQEPSSVLLQRAVSNDPCRRVGSRMRCFRQALTFLNHRGGRPRQPSPIGSRLAIAPLATEIEERLLPAVMPEREPATPTTENPVRSIDTPETATSFRSCGRVVTSPDRVVRTWLGILNTLSLSPGGVCERNLRSAAQPASTSCSSRRPGPQAGSAAQLIRSAAAARTRPGTITNRFPRMLQRKNVDPMA